ncbi:MAG: hypothetical protein LRY62_02240 [Alphaproteobacteria bacterium]|nr:hypothetical protein [Alphaproteobacteria bacterium]
MPLNNDRLPQEQSSSSSTSSQDEGHAHIERERAAYIGGSKKQQIARIKLIWREIARDFDFFNPPGHHSPSVALHTKSLLDDEHSELLVNDTPRRHIYYFDSLAFDLEQHDIQIRLERKQKNKGIVLKDAFDEVTIKIGKKADSRIEESVKIDLALWSKSGFWEALEDGIKKDIKLVKKQEGRDVAEEREEELSDLSKAMKKALGRDKLENLEIFPLAHIMRNSIETKYSPPDDASTIIELKTDFCECETLLKDVLSFSQFEAEMIAGDFRQVDAVMAHFCADPRLKMAPTNDCKKDPAYRKLRPWLVVQNDSRAEELRVQHNRTILEAVLDPVHFKVVDSKDLALIPAPAN